MTQENIQAQARDLSRNSGDLSELLPYNSDYKVQETLKNVMKNDLKSLFHFTIKNVTKNPTNLKEQTYSVMNAMLKRYSAELVDVVSEEAENIRFHLHGIFRARKNLRTTFKRFGWHIFNGKLNSFSEVENWSCYIHKQDQSSIIKYYEDGENHFLS